MLDVLRRALRRATTGASGPSDGIPPLALPPDTTPLEAAICRQVSPYSMTSVERLLAVLRATQYIVANRIAGDFVECGVWRGGSMMAAALALEALDDASRGLHLYDTFEGMPQPDGRDRHWDGTPASEHMARAGGPGWCRAGRDEVRRNLATTGYPMDKVRLVEGRVEESLPRALPASIAFLRLDTDWYQSTRLELEHLYPRLVPRGVLIIDDYGHWQGARQATDDYLETLPFKPFLHRIDYTARLLVKP